MATIAGDAPVRGAFIVRPEGDRTRARLVGARRVHLRDVLDQPDHARAVHLRLRAVHPEGQPAASAIILSGAYLVLPDDRLRGADRGDAARGRRLRLGEPRDRRRHRLRARRLRLVVHQLALGAHLREHPREGVLPAALGDHRLGSRRHLLGRVEGRVHVVGDHGVPGGRLHLDRHAAVREAPEVLLLRRRARPADRLRAPDLPLEGCVHLRVQPSRAEHVQRDDAATRTPRR